MEGDFTFVSEQTLENKNVTGGTGLTAGRDVTIGDVSGELAIKSYIENYVNKITIENPSGEALFKLITDLEQKRQEEVNLKILST